MNPSGIHMHKIQSRFTFIRFIGIQDCYPKYGFCCPRAVNPFANPYFLLILGT